MTMKQIITLLTRNGRQVVEDLTNGTISTL